MAISATGVFRSSVVTGMALATLVVGAAAPALATGDTGIVAAVAKAPITADGDVAGAPTDFVITLDTSLDPSVPGRTLLTGNTVKVTLPDDFLNLGGPVLNPGPPPAACPPPAGTCSTGVLLQGWPQHPIPPSPLNYTVGVEGTNTIVYTATQDLLPAPPAEPGLKQMHLILQNFVNPGPGRYEFVVEAETGPGGAVETGVAVVRIRPKPRASINVTSAFNAGTPNTIYQEAAPGATVPLNYDFLLWDRKGVPAVGVEIRPENDNHAVLVQGRKVVGQVKIETPPGASGQQVSSLGPSTPVVAPVLNLDSARLTAQFTAGDLPGLYTTTFSMNDGTSVQMFVNVADVGCDTNFVSEGHGAIRVTPNGVDDTANVECAIGKASGHEAKNVRLTEGTFHLDFLFADGFDGRIRGAGRDLTTIEPLAGGLDCTSVFDEFGFVFWMIFLDSNPTITDLALSIPDVACSEPYLDVEETDPDTGEVVFMGSFQDFNGMVLVPTRSPEPTDECGVTGHVGLTAKRINVDAPQPDFTTPVFNPQGAFNTFYVLGTTPVTCEVPDKVAGDVIVSDVYAEGVGSLVQAESVTNSKIKVSRNHTVAVDVSVLLVDNEGTVARVTNNTIEDATGVGVVSDNCTRPDPAFCLADTSHVTIANNDISMSEIAFAAIVADDGRPAASQVDVKIRRNNISVNGNLAGVFLFAADGARVAHNTFDGASVFGVLAEGPTTTSRVVDNDMTGHTAFEAGILLAPDTSLNVVKRNAGATVVDLGTDNTVQSEVPTAVPTARTSATTEVATAESRAELTWSTSYWSRR